MLLETERIVTTKATFTATKFFHILLVHIHTPKRIHLSSPSQSLEQKALSVMSDTSKLVPHYLISTGISDTKRIRLTESIFQINLPFISSHLILVFFKLLREKNTGKGNMTISGWVLLRLFCPELPGNWPQPAHSSGQAEERKSDLQVMQHVLFITLWLQGRGGFTLFHKVGRVQHLLSKGLPEDLFLLHGPKFLQLLPPINRSCEYSPKTELDRKTEKGS